MRQPDAPRPETQPIVARAAATADLGTIAAPVKAGPS